MNPLINVVTDDYKAQCRALVEDYPEIFDGDGYFEEDDTPSISFLGKVFNNEETLRVWFKVESNTGLARYMTENVQGVIQYGKIPGLRPIDAANFSPAITRAIMAISSVIFTNKNSFG